MPSASSSPPPQRTPNLRELPGGIDALDAELGALVGRRLLKAGTAEIEFTLLGHARGAAVHSSGAADYLDLKLNASSVTRGALGVLRLPFPQQAWGWRLYEVLPDRPTPAKAPPADAEGSARRRRDDMLRRVFS